MQALSLFCWEEEKFFIRIVNLLTGDTMIAKEEYSDFQKENIDILFEKASLTQKPETSFGKIWESIIDIELKKER